jgi:CheY-like chemotaxis protein
MVDTRILIVEDESHVTTDIEKRLRVLGYPAPATASSGKEAIEKAAECLPDVVLIDLQLKGDLDGVRAAQQICIHFNIPVIYLMDDVDDEALPRTRGIEPFVYIFKPVKDETLQISIEKALYKHKMGRLWRACARAQ